MICVGSGEFSGPWGNTVTFNAGEMEGGERRSASCNLILHKTSRGQWLDGQN